MLAINARVSGSNPTIDGYFSTSLKSLGKPSRLLQCYKNTGCGIQLKLIHVEPPGDSANSAKGKTRGIRKKVFFEITALLLNFILPLVLLTSSLLYAVFKVAFLTLSRAFIEYLKNWPASSVSSLGFLMSADERCETSHFYFGTLAQKECL